MIAIVYGNMYLIVIITRRTDGLKCFLIKITTVKNILVTFITFKEIPRDLDTCDIQKHLIDYVCYIKKNNNCRFHLSIYCLAILPVCLCTIAI
jgi:hypothetical protein